LRLHRRENVGSRAGTAQNASSRASCATVSKASLSVTMITSSQTAGSKVLGIKLDPMPSTLCGPLDRRPELILQFNSSAIYAGQLLLHKARYAGKRAASSNADDYRVNGTLHLFKDFFSGGFLVKVRIGGISNWRAVNDRDFAASSLAFVIAPCMPASSGFG